MQATWSTVSSVYPCKAAHTLWAWVLLAELAPKTARARLSEKSIFLPPLAVLVRLVGFSASSMSSFLLLAALHGVRATTTVAWGKEPMKYSSTGPSSTLASYFFMAKSEEGGDIWTGFNYSGGRGTPHPFEARTSCPADVFENTSPDLRVPKLPWRVQEDWGCERKPTEVDVLTIESDTLRAAVTPQWGGKVWSLYHKGLKKQLFFNNPAHQPANIGYLKAWSSGGAEWNWSPGYIGHSTFTESPVWTAVLPSKLGPVVRVWEYDRFNSSVWQVDLLVTSHHLPPSPHNLPPSPTISHHLPPPPYDASTRPCGRSISSSINDTMFAHRVAGRSPRH